MIAAKRQRLDNGSGLPYSSPHRSTSSADTGSSADATGLQTVQQPSPLSEQHTPDRKRRRQEADVDEEHPELEPATKREKCSAQGPTPEHCESAVESTLSTATWYIDQDQQWTDHVKNYNIMGDRQSRGSLKRGPSVSGSFRQSVSNGDSPNAWTARHQEDMAHAGIIMDEVEGFVMTAEDKEICNQILDTTRPLPQDWKYQRRAMVKIVGAAAPRNEARVVRDVQPYFFPSPEVEHFNDQPWLEHIAEGLGAQWSKCTVWCGPTPRPDGTISISKYVFEDTEREKLKWCNTSACERGVFPFYVCEAKSSDRSFDEARRQAMHSASIAVKTIIELFEKNDATQTLNGRLLAFSIAHNHQSAEICAHFPLINGDKHTFHRQVLRTVDLTSANSDWTAAYNIAFGIWKHFYPVHLGRIRSAVESLPNFGAYPLTAQWGLDNASSTAFSTPSSQEVTSSKRPALSEEARLQEENDKLLQLVEHQQQRSAEQLERQQQRSAEQLERLANQLEAQQKEFHEQLERQRKEAREESERRQKEAREESERRQREAREELEQQQRQFNEQRKELLAFLKGEGGHGSNDSLTH